MSFPQATPVHYEMGTRPRSIQYNSATTQIKGGQLKGIVELPMDVIRSTGNITSDIATGLGEIIGSATTGVAMIADAAGTTLDKMSKSLKVASVKVMDSVGEIAPDAASKLGKIVGVVPILGKPAAYVVKGAGKGVYYVVTSVGDITGEGIRGVGKVGKAASDMVVFTIATTGKTTQKVVDEAGKIVHKVTRDIAGKKHRKTARKSQTKKGKKAKKSKRHTRRN